MSEEKQPTAETGADKLVDAPWRTPATDASPPSPPKGEEEPVLEEPGSDETVEPGISPAGTVGPLIDIGGPGMQP